MNTSSPLVSVLMTSYNSEKYIEEAIESVYFSTYKNFELIIVDDCSKDNSVSIAKHWELKDSRIKVFVNSKNIGDYPNRNLAASYAKGKYIKYVDCDDKISTTCLEIMVIEMENHPDVMLGLCASNNDAILLLNSKQSYTDKNGILEFFGPTGSIMNLQYYFDIGKFKELVTVSDWDMWHRIAAKSPILTFPTNLVIWRDHPENTLKSNSHKIGVIKNYLKTKETIFKSNDCPISYQESRDKLKKYLIVIFRYSFKESFIQRDIRYIILFFRYNFKFIIFRLYK